MQVLLFLGFFRHIHDGSPSATDQLREALATANRGGHILGSFPPRVTLAGCSLRAGDLAAAIPELVDLEARLEAAEYPYWLSVTRSQLAFADLLRGRPDNAVQWCHAALATTAPTGVPFIDLFTQSVLASSLIQLERLDEAAGPPARSSPTPPTSGPGSERSTGFMRSPSWWPPRSTTTTSPKPPVSPPRHSSSPPPARPDRHRVGTTDRRPGCPAHRRPRQAEQLAHEALDVFLGANLTVYVPEVLDLLTILDLDQGDHAKAARLAGAASALRTRMTTTSLHLAANDHQLAAVDRCHDTDSSIATAWQAGESLTIEELMAWIKRGHGKRRRPTHGWSSLTPTEMSVITLIADGLTNPDIAARLFMSRRTSPPTSPTSSPSLESPPVPNWPPPPHAEGSDPRPRQGDPDAQTTR